MGEEGRGGHREQKWPLDAPGQGTVQGLLPGFACPTLGPSWPQVTAHLPLGPCPLADGFGHFLCGVGHLSELRGLPGLQGDWGHQQRKREPLHGHRR